MNDKFIITALEKCVNKTNVFISYRDPDNRVTEITVNDILGIIKHLKADNEKLKHTFIVARGCGKGVLEMNIEHIKEQAYKEFADRLKLYLHQDDFETPDERWKPESEFANLINNLVKEMVGDV